MPQKACDHGSEASLPVVQRLSVDISGRERGRLECMAAEIGRAQPGLATLHSLGARVRAGLASGPWLLVGDTREIALAKRGREHTYEYRLSLLARSGDAVLYSTVPHAAFEDYRSSILGARDVRAICLRPQDHPPQLPLADRCRLDPAAFGAVADLARTAGGLTILPHISTGSAWNLAGAIADATGVEVLVAGPPPRITRRVNDKLWFAELLNSILGAGALPPTFAVHGPAALAWRMRRLANSAERIVVKVPDSAGSAGNICLRAHDIAEGKLSRVRDHIIGVLRGVGWGDTYPLLVGLWEAPVVSSPSVQIWIPSMENGPPIIEGLFEQILEGNEGTFVGSVPAELPGDWPHRLGTEAMRIAVVLQCLGYFGRCSFDALLVGRTHMEAKLHWIECNGRWGGVSIPMTIVNRICPASANSFVVTQQTDKARLPVQLSEALGKLEDLLLKPAITDSGVLLLSPVEIEAGTGLQMIACAASTEEALLLSKRAVALLGSELPVPAHGSVHAAAGG